MQSEFTAIIRHDGDWYIAYCPDVPSANGQGRTPEESRQSLAEAIALLKEDQQSSIDSQFLNASPKKRWKR